MAKREVEPAGRDKRNTIGQFQGIMQDFGIGAGRIRGYTVAPRTEGAQGSSQGCAECVRAEQSMSMSHGTRLTALSCAILHRIWQAKQAGRMG